MRKKRWTEKQLKEKIKELKNAINRRGKMIKEYEEEIRDFIVLLEYYEEKLSERRNNPSSKQFGETE